MASPKERALDNRLLKMLDGIPLRVAEMIITDPEVKALQDYANTVSIRRLNFNDHGPVHMLQVAVNAIKMINVLTESGVKLNLETEEIGTVEESKVAVIMASLLHDVGMTVGRQNHERNGLLFALPIIEKVLLSIYKNDITKRVILRSMVIEGISGHMGTQKIHSLEAGTILVADGCDMKKGRARIPIMINDSPKIGDIHQYSAAAIEDVRILPGNERPIKIEIEMNASVGFHQVEEVLLTKIYASPLKKHIELYAWVTGRDVKKYL